MWALFQFIQEIKHSSIQQPSILYRSYYFIRTHRYTRKTCADGFLAALDHEDTGLLCIPGSHVSCYLCDNERFRYCLFDITNLGQSAIAQAYGLYDTCLMCLCMYVCVYVCMTCVQLQVHICHRMHVDVRGQLGCQSLSYNSFETVSLACHCVY